MSNPKKDKGGSGIGLFLLTGTLAYTSVLVGVGAARHWTALLWFKPTEWVPFWACCIPCAMALGFFAATLTRMCVAALGSERKGRIVEDRLFDIEHNGVDAPPMNHLDHLLWTCPGNTTDIKAQLRRCGIPIEAPAARLIPLNSSPTEEQIEDSRRYGKTG